MKKIISIFVAILIIIGGVTLLAKLSEKQATVLDYPKPADMTPDEQKLSEELFDGDKIVRIQISDGKKYTAISPVGENSLKGKIVYVSKFMNNGTYMVVR
jgi:hypothetical protein